MARHRLLWLLFVGTFALAVGHAQQAPVPGSGQTEAPNPTALILGQVLDASTSRPVAGAIVALSSGPAINSEMVAAGMRASPPARRVLTDAQGRFVFHSLGSGTYTFTTTASGYVDGGFGQRRPGGPAQPLMLRDDQRVANVTIRLWKESVLGGTVADETGEPVVGASVYALRRDTTGGRARTSATTMARTDDRGMYRFSRLLPGDYLVAVVSSLSNVPPGSAAAYQQALASAPGGNITGTDMYREISASRGAMPNGPGLPLGNSVLMMAPYSMGALPPRVTPDGKLVGYPTTYYPAATSASRASVVALAAGEERSSLDIQMRPATFTAVSGMLSGLSGPERNFGVRLVPAELENEGQGDGPFTSAVTNTDANGTFLFLGVPSGQYVLKASKVPNAGATRTVSVVNMGGGVVGTVSMMTGPGPGQPRPPLPPDPTLWAELPVSVGDDPVSGLALQLREAAALTGHFAFEGGTPPPPEQLNGATISFMRADGAPSMCCPASRVTSDAKFETQGYVPGKYFLSVTDTPGWNLVSATAGGRDILRAPLSVGSEPIADIVVTLASTAAEVSGTVTDQVGKQDAASSVVLFPAEYQNSPADGMNARLLRFSRPAPQTGAFRFLGVVPGDYLIAAADDDALANWQNPATIALLAPGATRITVGAGEKKVQNLATRSVR